MGLWDAEELNVCVCVLSSVQRIRWKPTDLNRNRFQFASPSFGIRPVEATLNEETVDVLMTVLESMPALRQSTLRTDQDLFMRNCAHEFLIRNTGHHTLIADSADECSLLRQRKGVSRSQNETAYLRPVNSILLLSPRAVRAHCDPSVATKPSQSLRSHVSPLVLPTVSSSVSQSSRAEQAARWIV